MSTPLTAIQQLLAPWMTGASPSALDTAFQQYGGTQGLFDAMLQADTPADYGKALQEAQGDALKNAASRQVLADSALDMQKKALLTRLYQAEYQTALGGNPTGSIAAPSTQTPGAGAPQSMPAAARRFSLAYAPPSAARQGNASVAPPSWLTPPTPQQIAATPVGGMSPAMLRLTGLLAGRDPLATAAALRKQQLALAQQRFAPALAHLDTLVRSDTPQKYVAADPQLTSVWQRLAPQLGFDPMKDFTDSNVRTAFTFARNQLAGALSEPITAPPTALSTMTLPDGRTAQVDPVTGKMSVIAPSPLTSVIGPDGPTLVPTAKAAGRAPYSAATFIDTSAVDPLAQQIADYRMAPLSGYALRSPQGQAVMARVQELNPKYDATQYAAKNKARMAFTSGKQSDTVRSLGVATDHLDQLGEAAQALQNGNMRVVNRIVNAFATETGNPKVTNFDAMKEIVGDEVVKAVVGTSGAQEDRDAIKRAFASANSPAQLAGVIQKYKGLMGGQLNGLRRQYEHATGLTDFDEVLSEAVKEQLSTARASSLGGSKSSGGGLSDAALLKKWGGQ